MSKHIKILVTGMGIGGPAVCYWLKRFGFAPVMIEKSSAIRKGGQGLDVRGIATHIAREMGIYDQINEMRTRIECGRFVDVAGHVLHEEHGKKFSFKQDDEVEIPRGEANHKLVRISSDNNPKTALVGLMFRSQHLLKNIRDEHAQKQFLCDTFRDFGWEVHHILNWLPKSDDFYFDIVTQVKMNSWTKGRVALIGDAGYSPSPLSGQGNNLALVGAYILAGELKAANGNYSQAFTRYNALLRSFVDANQKFGAWVSESFLVEDEVSKEIAEERSKKVLTMMKSVSNAITLPQYE
jgi:2-polyprenyl-6-methoxyphenol hydroxylase-like FAD-dependent oxidoreductase